MKDHTKSSQIHLLFIIMCFVSNGLYAQKFGDIDMARLKEESHSLDVDANYAYIFKNCYVRYDLDAHSPRLISEYHYRIKIYKNEGVGQANIVKYIYRNKKDRETIRNIKAECYNLVDGKVEKSKLSKKEVFDEKVDENTTKISFAIPNARAGSIIEFKYKISSPFLYSLPRHYFQENVPIDFSELMVDIPDYFTMAPIATGSIPLNRNQEIKTSFGANVTQYTFDASDIPGIEDDKYVLDIDDYRSSLKYELSVIAFPGRNIQNFTKDWNSICKNLRDSREFGGSIKKKVKQAEHILQEINALSDQEKLAKLVDYINANVVWNGEIGKYGSANYKKLFEAKKGDVGDINLLLINLCKKAGLNAYPVLTKYRFNGALNTSYPSLTEINYVFALVEVDGNQLFVDATSPYFEPGTLPLRALNIEGILMTDDGSQNIALTNTNLNYSRQAGKYTFNLNEKRLEGTGKYTMKGYAAVKARKKLKEEDDDEDRQDLVKGFEEEGDDEEDEDEQEDMYRYYDAKGFENKYGNITSAFDAQLYSPFEEIGDEIYVDAFVSLEFEENPFLNEQRKYSAFFNSKHYFNHVAILTIPEGYAIKSRPENIMLKMINDKGLFSYIINEGPGSITINSVFKINDDIFLPDEYSSLYEFFNQILLKQKEKIVFVKE